jgi:hypothetical protein
LVALRLWVYQLWKFQFDHAIHHINGEEEEPRNSQQTMKAIPRASHILTLLLLLSAGQSVQAQFSFLSNLIGAISSVASSLGGFISNIVDTIVLTIASAAVGGNPEALVCESIQSELSAADLDCTCMSDMDVAARTLAVDGTCTTTSSCPIPGMCGPCTITYDADGDVTLTDQTLIGTANIFGTCEIGTTPSGDASILSLTATLAYDGGMDDVAISVTSCSASFNKYKNGGITLVECTCSPDACTGSLEVSFTCSDGQSSEGCVKIDAFGN